MPTPELVVTPAGVPFKTWPGGLISLRASDWIGDSAGASVEADARAIEGEVVRETSVYTGNLDNSGNRATAMAAMDDTLTIDLSLVDFTAVSQDSVLFGDGDPFPMTYVPYFSVLVEGDWGTQQVGYAHTPLRFDRACMVGMYGDGFYPSINGNMQLGTFGFASGTYLRNCPQYRMVGFGDWILIETGTEVLHVRAFARHLTTIEILIDQIVLLPIFDGNWGYDYTSVYGGENTTGTTDVPVDGADAGDDNGKFTWHPRNSPVESTGGVEEEAGYGGGDYQQDDSEHMVEIVPEDEYTSASSWDDSPLPAQHAYSIVGAYHREAEVYVDDDFSRIVSGDFGIATGPASGGGYEYDHGDPLNATSEVDGARGHTHFSGIVPRDDGNSRWTLGGAPGVYSSDFTFSAKFEVAQESGLSIWDGSTTGVGIWAGMISTPGGSEFPSFFIEFDVMNARWRVIARRAAPGFEWLTPLSDWFDVSSWFTISTSGTLGTNEVAFKIELKRFLLRAKVWDVGGSEPGTWDHEEFHPVWDESVLSWVDYPYGDDGLLAAGWQQGQTALWAPQEMTFVVDCGGRGYVAQWDIYWDDVKCEFDPNGDTANVNALLEHPKGTEVGRIEVPSGAWHFVYWGRGQYATPHDFEFYSTGALDIAMKVWSDAGAAELQRAELPVTYFLGILADFTIVSMNYRTADRSGVATRVLIGG